MPDQILPLLVDPGLLYDKIDIDEIVIVDLSRTPVFSRNHIPGAVHLDHAKIIRSHPPVMGLLPDNEALSAVLSELGIRHDSHVVAYDDEGGGKAARFLWTLDVVGHKSFSLLDGGLQAWINEYHDVTSDVEDVSPSSYNVKIKNKHVADKEYIKKNLGKNSFRLIDTRTPGEFDGSDKRAHNGGHIPGASHFEWTNSIDQQNNIRLKPKNELELLILPLELSADDEIVTYCHSHHRSAHTYFVLKYLGFTNIKGYPGSWSDWGNDENMPIE